MGQAAATRQPWSVVGRDKASLGEAGYSGALRAWEGVWTYEDLNTC